MFGIIVLLHVCMLYSNFDYYLKFYLLDRVGLWYTEKLMVDTAKCQGHVVEEQAKIIIPPPLCLSVCADELFLIFAWCDSVHYS